MPEVIAILCSDLHLCEKPPIARAEEEDWFGVMKGYLDELKQLELDYDEVPVVVAGDVFDKWKSSPHLINFAIRNLPFMYTVAGQHDLPQHRLQDIDKSAFNTLGLCWKLDGWSNNWGSLNVSLSLRQLNNFSYLKVRGFSWEEKIEPPDKVDGKTINLLVAHKYVWCGDAKYPGVSPTSNVVASKGMFEGYDVALLGDNHKSWMKKVGKTLVYNPGSFMRTRSDQIDHRPQVGLLKDDCTIDIHYLDVSKDKISTVERVKEVEKVQFDMDEFLEGLKGLGEGGLDFVEAVKNYMDTESVDSHVRKTVMEAIEG